MSHPTTTDTPSRAFLRHRVARFGLLVGGLFGSFLTFRIIGLLTTGWAEFGTLVEPSFLWHGAATLAFAGVWLACRVGPESTAYVRAVETAGLLLGTGATALMGSAIPAYRHPEMIMLMALTLGLTSRAVYVPSSPGRTLGLGALMGLPIIGATYLLYSRITPGTFGYDPLHDGPPAVAALRKSVATAVWWALAVTVATAASKVIYGLRREVRDAQQVGQYQLDEKLGEGGMGVVYRAHHALLRRPTAVKLLPRDKAGDSIERFEREVQMTARLRHPNTVTIYDYGRSANGVFYYAMELIEGATLAEVVEVGGAQPEARVRALLRQAADALVEAHGIGLIHRDIKPANMMVFLPHRLDGLSEMVKVVDFGLVKSLDAKDAAGVTHTGTIAGTPQYMAPESITDPERVDARTDLYALGAVGYFLLAGRHVFEGKTVIEVCSKHLNETPVPPSARRGSPVHEGLEKLILACLEKDPARRPASAAILRDRLDALTGLGAWGPAEAREWWAELGDVLERNRAKHVVAIGETLDIRFAERAPAPND